jgi:tRNA A37 threonylcarbamoyladenosine biosynthesis protein TsaE
MECLGWSLQQQLGSPGTVFKLTGQLGAGKSTISRGFVRAFCRDPLLEVPSPTYLLCLSYQDDLAHDPAARAAAAAAEAAAVAADTADAGPSRHADEVTAGGSCITDVHDAATAAAPAAEMVASGLEAAGHRPPSVHHMDPYRLSGTKSDRMAGLIDFAAAFRDDVCLIEWPDRMPAEVLKLPHKSVVLQVRQRRWQWQPQRQGQGQRRAILPRSRPRTAPQATCPLLPQRPLFGAAACQRRHPGAQALQWDWQAPVCGHTGSPHSGAPSLHTQAPHTHWPG